MKTIFRIVTFLIINCTFSFLFAMKGKKSINLIPEREITITFNNFSGQQYDESLEKFYATAKKCNITPNTNDEYVLNQNTSEKVFLSMIDLNAAIVQDQLTKYIKTNSEEQRNTLEQYTTHLFTISSQIKNLPRIYNYAMAWFWKFRKKITLIYLPEINGSEQERHACLQVNKHVMNLPRSLQKRFAKKTQNVDYFFYKKNNRYWCSECQYKTTKYGNARRHIIQQHLKLTRYACDICQQEYYYKYKLITHKKKHR